MPTTKVIRYIHNPTAVDLSSLESLGCRVVHISTLAPEVTISVPDAYHGRIGILSERLYALYGVTRVEDDFPVSTVLKEVAPLVAIEALWHLGRATGLIGPIVRELAQGQGIRVAILDTGIDPSFPGFTGRLGLYKDYVGEGAAPDAHGHGTHCAGILAQTSEAEVGYIGMAPGVVINMYKVLDSSGSGSAAGIAQALEDALVDGADVISLSLGGDSGGAEPDFLQRRADLVGARIPVVVAAGNNGPKGSRPFRETPARAANVITVGASDDNDIIAAFTSRGVTDDNRVKPNVYAPGHQIAAARAKGTSMGQVVSEWTTIASGTSMAAPCVAGMVAALLSHDPSLKGRPQQIKSIFMSRGVSIGAEGLRVSGLSLGTLPYPNTELGVDKVANVEPEDPPSPCEDLLVAAFSERDAEKRRKLLRRALATMRTALVGR